MGAKGEQSNCCCCGWAYQRSVLRQVRHGQKNTIIALICATCQARVARAKTEAEERK